MKLFSTFCFFSIPTRATMLVIGGVGRPPKTECRGGMMLRVSVDIGGTFTDMVLSDTSGNVAMFKSPSTPGQLSRGVMDCLRKAATERGTSLTELLAQV